ncbi:MAG: radical SAM protein [Candidatus Nanoarchaeia archaeon]|nr:radical SAM protein [Candidatus Nanoarchaeia archaeon]
MKSENKIKILLVYPPFCTPEIPPFSITNIYSFLKNNLNDDFEIKILDLNIDFHNLCFPEFKEKFQKIDNLLSKDYQSLSEQYKIESTKIYSHNNKKILNNEKPDYFDELFLKIVNEKPDLVGISLVYSSQDFYANILIRKLNELNIKTIIGGPAVNEKLLKISNYSSIDKYELLNKIIEIFKIDINNINNNEIKNDKIIDKHIQDFSIHDYSKYFIPNITIPLQSSSTCYYRKCAFCTHFDRHTIYKEFLVDEIKETILKSKAKNFFFIDDMIHKRRLLEIANMIKPLNVNWACQLKPIKELDFETLKILYESGLKYIIWGVESASQRVLDLMNKGTNINDVKNVLENTKKVGIKNSIYIMFGFPTETESELNETIDFLEKNKENIDLISISIFGLHENSDIFKNPEKYSIKKINIEERTMLEPKITYEIDVGINTEKAIVLRKRYANLILKIDKFPKNMNFFRGHFLNVLDNTKSFKIK